MKTRTVMIGLIILVVGVVLFVGGAIGALGSLTINTAFTQPHPGEYVSSEIVLNTTSSLVVSSPAALGGIIHAQDLGLVNSSNLGTYTIQYDSTGAGSDIYTSLVGDYYYVAFSSTQPSATIVVTNLRGSVVGYGALVLLGIVCAIAGIAVAIIGVFQKKRPPVQGQT